MSDFSGLSAQDVVPWANIPLSAVEEVDAVEKLQETAESAGWSIQYRQLHPGPLRVRSLFQEADDISLVGQTVNRHMETVGEAPADLVSIIFPISGKGLRINGRKLNEDRLAIVPPGTQANFTTGGLLDAASIYLPTSTFEMYAHAITPDWNGLNNGVATVKPRSDLFMRLRRQAIWTTLSGTGSNSSKERISAVAAAASSLIADPGRTSLCDYRQSTTEKFRVLALAQEYVHGHLTELICVPDLCRYSGTSLSKLERVFRDVLQMSPSQYVRALRLEAARRDLKHADSACTQVASIAMNYGFHHLGRFAGAYRSRFGELPSTTLRAA